MLFYEFGCWIGAVLTKLSPAEYRNGITKLTREIVNTVNVKTYNTMEVIFCNIKGIKYQLKVLDKGSMRNPQLINDTLDKTIKVTELITNTQINIDKLLNKFTFIETKLKTLPPLYVCEETLLTTIEEKKITILLYKNWCDKMLTFLNKCLVDTYHIKDTHL